MNPTPRSPSARVTPDHRKRDYLPTPAHEWLLRAALMDDETALEAWQHWRAQMPSATDPITSPIDDAACRLLPLVYQRLNRLGVRDEWMPRLREMYQHTWLKNQWMMRKAGQVLAALQAQNIPTLLLKGLPVMMQHYGDPGTRPMGDFDVLVPTASAGPVVEWLLANGWRQVTVRQRTPSPRYRYSRHSFNFVNDQGDGFDLHWFALLSCCYPGADEDWWQGAVPLVVDGVPTLTLRPEDMLLHTCGHATLYDTVAPIRWVADALMILRSAGPDFDWQRVLAQARQRRLTQPIAEMLTYLQERFDAPIPGDILIQLHAEPVLWSDSRMFELFASNKSGLLRKAARHLHSYRRYTGMWRQATQSQPPISLFEFLLNQTGLQHPLQLAQLSWHKLTRTS